MATNTAYEILIDSDDQNVRTRVVDKLMTALAKYTVTTTYNASYSAGSTSVNQVTITVEGTGTVNVGVRITFDSAIVGTGEVASILRKVLSALAAETTTVAHAASYTAGDRTYNVIMAVA